MSQFSIGILLGLCWVTAAIRFYVRLRIQTAFSIDDGFLLFGLVTLTSSVGVLYSFLQEAYGIESFLLGQESLVFQPGFIDAGFDFQKLVTVVLILSWIAISCVKLSFMFLFRRLIYRLQYAVIYWWTVLIFVIAVAAYGTAVYVVACPYYYSLEDVKCEIGLGLQRSLNYAVSQIVLDIVSDVLILVIPIHIVWKINVGRKQKFWLALSLCLTIVVIAVTIIRVSGIKTPTGHLDSLWEDYWNVISAEVGLIMTSATSFRTLYISKTATAARKQEAKSPNLDTAWISVPVRSIKHFLAKVIDVRSWIIRNSDTANKSDELNDGLDTLVDQDQSQSLPHYIDLKTLPGAHMTGVQTFIGKAGQETRGITPQHLMQSHSYEDEVPKIPVDELQNLSVQVVLGQQQQQQQNQYEYAIYNPLRSDACHPEQQEHV